MEIYSNIIYNKVKTTKGGFVKKRRTTVRIFRKGVILLILLSLIVGVIPLQTSAAELSGYAAGAIVRTRMLEDLL